MPIVKVRKKSQQNTCAEIAIDDVCVYVYVM